MGGGRRSKFKSRPGRTPARVPPSEATGRESGFLRDSKERTAPVIVHLLGGQEARGVITYYDTDVIKLECTDGPGLLIRKSDIRYVVDAPGPAT